MKYPRISSEKSFFTLFTFTLILSGIFSAFVWAANPSPSAKAGQSAESLNQKEIHNAYNEGDFDKVLSLIDTFNRTHKTYPKADSIFLAKHLAVVYSANPKTREKGKYFMYRMLEMLPSAELVDMFVSDEIDRIFDKVRREYLVRQQGFGIDSTQITSPSKPSTGSAAAASTQTAQTNPASSNSPTNSSPSASSSSSSSDKSFFKRNAFWIAGGAGLAIAGVAAIVIISQDTPAAGKTISIPNKTTAAN